VYRQVPRTEILDALAHLRELHRQIGPSNDRERYAFERREPTLNMLLEISNIFSLTIEGAHRLFGYDLDGIREYDLRLNGGRTHIERPHKRLRPGKVHRALCMSYARERNPEQSRRHNAHCAEQVSFGEGLRQSLGKVGCAAGHHGMASTRHWHLHRLVSVGICRDDWARAMPASNM
jgi:hypothetical protein